MRPPYDEYNLTWGFIWSLIRMRISSPRANYIRFKVIDYAMNWREREARK